MSHTKRETLERIRGSIKKFQEEEQRLATELGEPSVSGESGAPPIIEAKRQEIEDAVVFEKLTPAERTQLRVEEPETREKMLKAHEHQGYRKLLRW